MSKEDLNYVVVYCIHAPTSGRRRGALRRELAFLTVGYITGCFALGVVTLRTIIAVFSPSKAVIIYVNNHGEMYLDVLALGVLWALTLVGFWVLLKTLSESKDSFSKSMGQKWNYREDGVGLSGVVVHPLFGEIGVARGSFVDPESGVMMGIVEPFEEVDTSFFKPLGKGDVVAVPIHEGVEVF